MKRQALNFAQPLGNCSFSNAQFQIENSAILVLFWDKDL